MTDLFTIKRVRSDPGYSQSIAMKKVWKERHSGERPMIIPGARGNSTKIITPFCFGFRIETQDKSPKGKHYPLHGLYCLTKKRYKIVITELKFE